ncbi:uncharacterized protein (DUF1810 family) [Frigoribacterium sp. PhB107]|uniref:DUF1810 domain-containing protein n=1 Tax=Frigoribacterium sp. PhB107 TaxID=2485172 RepID=UPI000F479CF9|nr:DUF1810 domain-containing protein [Frigoribacterium sp. PhB107]ROP75316.1 uncharacterized protein (DUF1810 family) [Frigoribacterium sp. PhB107]
MTDDDLLSRHDLDRFVDAQEADGTYDHALRELRAGRKRGHWMWFVFPQVAGLGTSATSQHFALETVGAARAFLAHPVLGPRLLDCVDALLELPDGTVDGVRDGAVGPSAVDVLGEVDAMKLHSSLTLFAQADPSEERFARALGRFFDGTLDPATLERL